MWNSGSIIRKCEDELGNHQIAKQTPDPYGAGKYIVVRTFEILVVVCCFALMISTGTAEHITVLFGTHTAAPGRGFSASRFDTDSGSLTKPRFLLEAAAPAYYIIAPGGRRLYTCNSTGFISAYSIEPASGNMKLLNQKSSGGGDPSYISMDKTSKYVFVANYEGGSVAAWALKLDGSLGKRTAFIQHSGSSINAQRQTHAYAHSIVVDSSNRFALVADLGLDKLFVYKFNVKDGSLTPNNPAFVTVTAGAGPRHVIFHPKGRWVYLITEMGNRIIKFNWDGQHGTLTEDGSVTTLPENFHGASTCAEMRIHPSGKFLYASNRGHDSIAVFSIDSGNGRLTPIQDVPSGGRTPRNFDFDPSGNWLLVTNQDSNNAMVMRIDRQTGLLTPTGKPVELPSPFCPRFLGVPR